MIEGKNVILRTVRESDLEKMFNLNENVLERGDYYPKNFKSLHTMKKKFQENSFWEGDKGGLLLITDKNDNPLGSICFFKGLIYQEGYEIGYQVFDSKSRGKGIMTEACKIFCAYLFGYMPIPRLQANIFVGNKGSSRILEKCGFQKEGVMRKAAFQNGELMDLELYSILREECPSLKDVLAGL